MALNKEEINEIITIQRLKIWPLNGEVQGLTFISVLKNNVSPEGYSLSRSEHADKLRDIEEKNLRNQSDYDIEDLEKDNIEYKNKTLYSMSWKTTKGSAFAASFKRTFFAELVYYIYFPENFEDTHIFYNFLITETYIPGPLIPINTEQIFKIIDGFELKDKKS